ncbi:MAG: PIN domain-containing protein [Myxococcaceae bacterium]|nr:PIN domain-containing protein [Myxococcaceae bacterium]
MKKAIFDTNIWVGWLRDGLHEELMAGRELTRYLSTVVQMELRAGAFTARAGRALDGLFGVYHRVNRIVGPSLQVFDQCGRTLKTLRRRGRGIRRASLVNDVLIAVTARSIGATVFTSDGSDFEAINEAFSFDLEIVAH